MNTYLAFFGHKQVKGGWFIQEQMIINASSYDKAWAMAEARCYPGEQVLDVSVHVPREDVIFWGV
jgi:hypothetical protein